MNNYINLDSFISIYESTNKHIQTSFRKIFSNSISDQNNFSSNEMTDLYSLLTYDNLIESLNENQRNGFFLSYSIPIGLGEEFDILRFSNEKVLNIELKHELPELEYEDILNQLIRHKIILNLLNKKETICCTYLKSTNKLYILTSDNTLEEVPISNLVCYIADDYSQEIELSRIDLTDLIISPYTCAKEFAEHKYFLNSEQNKAVRNILESDKRKFVLVGGPGTGKTMVLLDLAKKYKKRNNSVLIVFTGNLSNYLEISSELSLDVVPIKNFNWDRSNEYDVILIDEAQRLWKEQFDCLYDLATPILVFSVDHKQTLHPTEISLDIENKLLSYEDVHSEKLKDKIRTDPVMSSFIQKFLNLKATKIQPCDYSNVKVSYFATGQEASNYIDYMCRTENYYCIEPTEYVTKSFGNLKRPKKYNHSLNSHSVIGKEYDNIIVPIDEHYYYNKNAKLQSDYHLTEHYPYDESRCVFEALTRVKKNLVLVVINNPTIYTTIQEILTWKKDSLKELIKKNECDD